MQFISIFTTLLGVALALPASSILPRDASAASLWSSKNLHILPLGASITFGTLSSDGNGYRLNLRNLLSPAAVTYVGTQCGGSMSNANNEGHPGWMIPQMQAVAAPNMAQKPNVVLVYVGTNDMKYGDQANAPQNLQKLVSYLTSNLPGSLIVVSKLFLNNDPTTQKHIETFNAQISALTFPGNVMVADFSNTLVASDLADGTHPNDGGYAKMAAVFQGVLNTAQSQGRIPQPASFPQIPSFCNGPPSIPSTPATPANGQNAKQPVSSAQVPSSTSTTPSTSSTSTPAAPAAPAATTSSTSSNTPGSSSSGSSSVSSAGSSTTSISPISSAINKPLPSSSTSSATSLASASPLLAVSLTILVCAPLFLF